MVKFVILLSTIITLVFPPLAYCMHQDEEEEDISESQLKQPSISQKETTKAPDLDNPSQQMNLSLALSFKKSAASVLGL